MQECMVCGRVAGVILIEKFSNPIRKGVPVRCVRVMGEICSQTVPVQLKFS
jgi:hypothetical protein